MVSLLEIASLTEAVTIRGQDFTVSGLTAQDLVDLMLLFPELQYVFAGQSIEGDMVTTLMGRAGVALGHIIAMGLGERGDNKNEIVAFSMTKLTAGEQADLIAAIMRLTFPKGIKSFVDGLQAAADSAGVRGKAPPMKSRGRSPASSPTATTSTTAGDTPQGNSLDGSNSLSESSKE